jgi:hypothetical protein
VLRFSRALVLVVGGVETSLQRGAKNEQDESSPYGGIVNHGHIQTAMKYTHVLGQEYDRVPESGLLLTQMSHFVYHSPGTNRLGVVFAGG